jgi:hypothetical protein
MRSPKKVAVTNSSFPRNVRQLHVLDAPVKSVTNQSIEPLFVDIHGAAHILGFTVWAVRNLIWDRKIRYVKRGRKYFFSPADLRDYAEKLLTESEVA